MELKLIRKHFGENFTIGEITSDKAPNKLWYTMEDKDRGLNASTQLTEINRVKVFGETAIPYGRYQVIINKSTRFKINLPLLLNVKGWDGVRMHVGNYAKDTEGCILIGTGYSFDNKMITNSRTGFGEVYELIEKAINNKETVFITITKEALNV